MLLNRPDNLGEAMRTGGDTTLGQRVDVYTPDKIHAVPLLSDEMRAAMKSGWKAAYSLAFDGLDRKAPKFLENLAPHHRRALRWHWISRHIVCSAATVIGFKKWARWLAYFVPWSRGHMKSTQARYIAVMDAMISLYYGVPGYCLYLSGSKDKVQGHATSIYLLVTSARMKKHAPLLSHVKKVQEKEKDEKTGRSLGWKQEFFYTAAEYIFHFSSLQSGLAGANFANVRITMMILDDIDDRKDSPVEAERKFNLLTSEILAMGAAGTLVFWAQNFINRYSCMYRIYRGHKRVLTSRMRVKPVPAIVTSTFRTEVQTVDGTVRDIIQPGAVATWPQGMPVEDCQEELNKMGLPAFLREAQHEVEQSVEGRMLYNYEDSIHVISESEFASVYGTRKMPESWPKEWGNDWARTKTAKHANVAMWRTVSAQGSALPGFNFYFHPMSFPANSPPEDVAERVLSCLSVYATRRQGTRLNPLVERMEAVEMTWGELRRDTLIRANALLHTTRELDRIEFERAALQDVIPQYSEPLLARHNVIGGVNSHEREDIRLIYNAVYALKCVGINPGKFGGIEQMNRNFAVDMNEEHPFRPGVKGFTRTFIVVPDDTSQAPVTLTTSVNGVEKEVIVYPPHPFPIELTPDELHDDRLIRYQFVNWRLRDPKITETGEMIDDPLKMDDDFGNLGQMFEIAGYLENTPLTVQQQFKMLVESRSPQLMREGEIVILNKQDQQALEFTKMLAEEQIKEKHGPDVFEVEDGEVDNWWE